MLLRNVTPALSKYILGLTREDVYIDDELANSF